LEKLKNGKVDDLKVDDLRVDDLRDEGLIDYCNQAKSLYLMQEGENKAKKIVEKLKNVY